MDNFNKSIPVSRDLLAKALGDSLIDYVCSSMTPADIATLAESNAVDLLREIQAILDDESLEDDSCFRRIDAIVSAFQDHGLSTTRHDF